LTLNINNHYDFVISGSGLSSLVSAEQLLSAGYSVLLCNHSKTWGGVFNGITVSNKNLDIGMTNFEFDLFGENTFSLDQYNPNKRNDSRHYSKHIRDYISSFVDVVKVKPVEMFTGGKFSPDPIISGNLEGLRNLPASITKQIISELEYIVKKPNIYHASLKYKDNTGLFKKSLKLVSEANHGKTFHNMFVEPMCKKVLNVSTDKIPAILHRAGWAPLYYPETLLSQFTPNPQTLEPLSYHYPREGYFSSFIRSLIKKIESFDKATMMSGVKIERIEKGSKLIDFEEFSVHTDHMVWGDDLYGLANLLCIEYEVPCKSKANLEILYFDIPKGCIKNPFSVLISPDPQIPFYRVVNQSVQANIESDNDIIIIEINSDYLKDMGYEISDYLNGPIHNDLAKIGINSNGLEPLKRLSAKGALTIPSFSYEEEYQTIRAKLSNCIQGIEFIGPASSMFPVTFNDHIVHGLQLGQESGA